MKDKLIELLSLGFVLFLLLFLAFLSACGGYYGEGESSPASIASFSSAPSTLLEEKETESVPAALPSSAATEEEREESFQRETVAALADERVDLVNIGKYDPRLIIDLRYAGRNNPLREPVYSGTSAYLARPAAEALARAASRLEEMNYRLIILDAYRPYGATVTIWERAGRDHPLYFEDPLGKAPFSRGLAVDVSLANADGKERSMPSAYNPFEAGKSTGQVEGVSRSAALSNLYQRRNRAVLTAAMEAEGFEGSPAAWWRFVYRGGGEEDHPVLNIPLEVLASAGE